MSSSAGGWRGRRRASYATEAALAALKYGFDSMGLPEIVAVTMARNLRSRAVMRRIGMTSDPAEDFDDPTSTRARYAGLWCTEDYGT